MTREEYMTYGENEPRIASEIRHQEYYMQFAKAMRSSCSQFCSMNGYTAEHIRECFAEDRHLNNLDRGLVHTRNWMKLMDAWIDQNKGEVASINFRINGTRTYCIADGCCILKAYMIDMAGIDVSAPRVDS